LGKDSPLIKEKKVAICQSLSGTGALRISAEFLAQFNPGVDVYCSDPTWGNHHSIFGKAGLKTFKYRYLNKVPYPRHPLQRPLLRRCSALCLDPVHAVAMWYLVVLVCAVSRSCHIPFSDACVCHVEYYVGCC
jgi:hypothetical protein